MTREGWHRLTGIVLGLLIAGGIGATIGIAVLLSGSYNTAATRQHYALTHWVLETGLKIAIAQAAEHVAPGPPEDTGSVARGSGCYSRHCAQCHGAPGVAPESFAQGMLPIPTSLAQSHRDWNEDELFLIVSKGVRMTGMPAWEYRLATESRWDIVRFLKGMPAMTRAEYERLSSDSAAQCRPARDGRDIVPEKDSDPDPRRVVLRQYACHACHRIEGMVGPALEVGPVLRDWSRRVYIAGVLPNTPDNLVRWIREPHAVSPDSLMPDLAVSESHARAMASYLFHPERP